MALHCIRGFGYLPLQKPSCRVYFWTRACVKPLQSSSGRVKSSAAPPENRQKCRNLARLRDTLWPGPPLPPRRTERNSEGGSATDPRSFGPPLLFWSFIFSYFFAAIQSSSALERFRRTDKGKKFKSDEKCSQRGMVTSCPFLNQYLGGC